MPTTSHAFLDAVAKCWAEILPSLSSRGVESRQHIDTGRGTMSIEIESSVHLAAVQVWEQSQCLDVTIMTKSSHASKILSAGQCVGEVEIDARLLDLRDTLLGADAK
jgi:hypothetical protein